MEAQSINPASDPTTDRSPVSTPSRRRHVVITVHGIRTFGSWQDRLKRLLEAQKPDVLVFDYKYGYFSSIAFLVPPLRWLATLHFRRELQRVAQRHSGAQIDIVAHSFGTHLVGWGLHGIPLEQRPAIRTIILAGSVLRPDFPWGSLLDEGTLGQLMNECGTKDWILVVNQVAVLFTGMAGRLGFNGMISSRFRNNWYRFGHSDYFLKDGNPDDGFLASRCGISPRKTMRKSSTLDAQSPRPFAEMAALWRPLTSTTSISVSGTSGPAV